MSHPFQALPQGDDQEILPVAVGEQSSMKPDHGMTGTHPAQDRPDKIDELTDRLFDQYARDSVPLVCGL